MTSHQRPKTLRDLAGRPTRPPPLTESAPMVIDAQIAYSRNGTLPLPDIDHASARLGELDAFTKTALREQGAA